MLESAWLFIGVVSLCATGVAVLCKTEGARLVPNDDSVAIASGTLGFVGWAIWTYGALNVQTPIEGTPELVTAMPSVALFGVAIALVPGYIALTGPVDIVREYRRTDPDNL
jgi:hypothetical protein